MLNLDNIVSNEYSSLGKVFTDGLDKSDKNEGLLKTLKNIEDKSNNQLLAIKNISRPAIKRKFLQKTMTGHLEC